MRRFQVRPRKPKAGQATAPPGTSSHQVYGRPAWHGPVPHTQSPRPARTHVNRASHGLKYLTVLRPPSQENVVYLNLWLVSQTRMPSPAARTRTSSRFACTTSALNLQSSRTSRAQRKKRPARRSSGDGRMRGAQAGGCLPLQGFRAGPTPRRRACGRRGSPG